jgi:hypothetical protein
MTKFNARDLPTTAVALSLVLAPLFALASALVAPALKSDHGAQLEVISQHPDRWYAFSVLLLIGSILLVPALLGVAGLVRERCSRLGDLGGGLAVLGFAIAIGHVMTLLVMWQMGAQGADHAEMTALLDRFENAAGANIVFAVGGLATVVGTVLLSIGLIRGRVVPSWAAIALSVAVVLDLAGYSASSNAVVVVSWAVLLVAMSQFARLMAAAGRRGHVSAGARQATPAGAR